MTRFRLLVIAPVVLAALGIGSAALLLLTLSQTVAGRLVAIAVIAGLIGTVAIVSWLGARGRRRRIRLQLGLVHLGAAFVLLAVCTAVAPDGMSPDDAPLQSIRDPSVPFRRTAPANLIPEIDQILVGLWALPYGDPNITEEKAERIGAALARHHQAMESHPEFVRVGSSLDLTYNALLGRNDASTGHVYSYAVAPPEDDGKRPILLWLHGRGGNLKAAVWMLRPLADQAGFILVAPTCGNGDWSSPAGERALGAALAHCQERQDADLGRVCVVAHDRGASAIPTLLADPSWTIDRLALLSPIGGAELLGSEAFAEAMEAGSTRLLVIHGREDLEAPSAELEAAVNALNLPSRRITHEFLQDEDHYFVWTRSSDLVPFLASWASQR